MSKENENVDLFNMSADDASLNVFDKKQTNQDGIYRPRYKDAKDKKAGYHAKIRFIANRPLAIERHMHYADFKDDNNIKGWYDCAKNFENEKCDLCTNYWNLKNSKNQVDVEKADLISRQTKYYSYVLILEDDNHPELVGKIMVFSYGYTIKEKIKSEKEGEINEKCNVFDLECGKDFKLIIKQKGEFDDYTGSQFLEVSPIKIWNEEKKKFVVPQVDENGKVTNPKAKEAILKFIGDRDDNVNLDNHLPKRWDEETRGKINNILARLNGDDITRAERSAKSGGSAKTTASKVADLDDELDTSSVTVSEKDFFDSDDDLNN